MIDQWTSPASAIPVGSDEIQVWRLASAEMEWLSERSQLLSQEERIRAERRLPGRVRREFVHSRVALRLLLGQNLGVPPESVAIAYDETGKPRLDGESGVSFNVSHSHGILLFALSRTGGVGIDVEYADIAKDVMELAPMVFSLTEMEELTALDESEDRRSLFYRTWVRKEALVKADGRGLSVPLNSFEVPENEAWSSPVSLADKCYFLYDIALGHKFRAAAATESKDCRITFLNFPVMAESWFL